MRVSFFAFRATCLAYLLGSRGSEVQILSPRPVKKGLTASAASPFCIWVAFWVAFGREIHPQLPLFTGEWPQRFALLLSANSGHE
jgi:hypothetical protein